MANIIKTSCCEEYSRRELLRKGLGGLGFGLAMPTIFGHTSMALAAQELEGDDDLANRILVVLELAGGNDGLNTVVPHGNDEYYRARPTIAIAKKDVHKIDDDIGFHFRMSGFKSLWDEGKLALVQGCGYPNPNRSHFTSMEYWHTAVPNGADPYGWVGRFADRAWPEAPANTLVNIAGRQSLAVQSERHAPIVFSDPERFARDGDPSQDEAYERLMNPKGKGASSEVSFLRRIAKTADRSSQSVREAIRDYSTPVSYGLDFPTITADLKKVAALINANFPTRVYYVSFDGFDTHGNQINTQEKLLLYVADAVKGFMDDMKRQGRGPDVAMMIFTEFGRRVSENQSGGTDHGTATPMYIVGENVEPGLYGEHPSLTDLDGNGDLVMTTDFRNVYATLIEEWMGCNQAGEILKGDFRGLGVFA